MVYIIFSDEAIAPLDLLLILLEAEPNDYSGSAGS